MVTPVGDISVNMLKVTLDIRLSITTKIINLLFENGYFPDDLKLAEISPIFKKNDDLVNRIWNGGGGEGCKNAPIVFFFKYLQNEKCMTLPFYDF